MTEITVDKTLDTVGLRCPEHTLLASETQDTPFKYWVKKGQ